VAKGEAKQAIEKVEKGRWVRQCRVNLWVELMLVSYCQHYGWEDA